MMGMSFDVAGVRALRELARFEKATMTACRVIAAATMISAFVVSAQAQEKVHPCAADALQKAKVLLRLQSEADASQPLDVEDSVKLLPPVKALKGKGRFDVLEVWGHVYKADYRMRFIYAQIPNTCALMGQEILEADNPY
jgi:hypothetical protein